MTYPVLNTTRKWSPLTELHREMDSLMNDFWAAPATNRGLREVEAQWSPACDVEEAANHYLISLEVAGIPKDQIKVEAHDQQLVITGERRQEKKEKTEGGQWYSERLFGKFQRAFHLPKGSDLGKIEASYQDGVLKIYIPKAVSTQPRQIPINHEAELRASG